RAGWRSVFGPRSGGACALVDARFGVHLDARRTIHTRSGGACALVDARSGAHLDARGTIHARSGGPCALVHERSGSIWSRAVGDLCSDTRSGGACALVDARSGSIWTRAGLSTHAQAARAPWWARARGPFGRAPDYPRSLRRRVRLGG